MSRRLNYKNNHKIIFLLNDNKLSKSKKAKDRIVMKNNSKKEKLMNEKEKDIIKKNILLMNHTKLFKFIFIIGLIRILSSDRIFSIYSRFSKITLTIKGEGNKKILGYGHHTYYFDNSGYPNEIHINGFNQSSITHTYSFTEEENIVELIWKENINNCSCMFYECSDITEINFFYFNSSEVKRIDRMFTLCSSLASINLSTFDTSQVTYMVNMFHGCQSLLSLNLSNFDTSQISRFSSLFNGCSSLKSLDLSNFNTSKIRSLYYTFYGCSVLQTLKLPNFINSKVEHMEYTFYNCLSLISLDLSNFFTSKVIAMNYTFSGCKKLESLDLSNFDTSQVTRMDKMFYDCSSLTTLNLSNFNTSKVENMDSMFAKCSSLTLLDVSNFNTSKVVIMNGTFNECSSLKSLNIRHFDTSQVTMMDDMFKECHSLTSLNVSNFNTSLVKKIDEMFYNCYSLTSLNLSNFDTSQVTFMYYMFYNCSSLTILDLSNFNTSKVKHMNNMFKGCSSLTSLNLSTFDTSLVTTMTILFESCINLQYINMKNFNEINIKNDPDNYLLMFEKIPDNVVICINEGKTFNKILPQIKNKLCYTIDCSDNWKLNQKKIINRTGVCIDSCDNDTQNKYEYNGKCYDICPNRLISNHINKCKCEKDKCFFCAPEELNYDLCIDCNEDYFPIENDPSNIGEYINCYKKPEGFYLDKYKLLYRKCYHTCKICEIKGDNETHNCLYCNENYPNQIIFNNYTNCYDNESYFDYLNNKQKISSYLNNIDIKDSSINKNYYTNIISSQLYQHFESTIYNIFTQIIQYTENIAYTTYNENMKSTANIRNIEYTINSDNIKYTNYNKYTENNEHNKNSDYNEIIENTKKSGIIKFTEYSILNSLFHKTNNNLEYPEHSDRIVLTYKLINNENITQKFITTSHKSPVIYECKNDDPTNNNCNFLNIKNNTDILNIIKDNLQSIYDPETGKSQVIKGEDDIIFQVTNGKNELEL